MRRIERSELYQLVWSKPMIHAGPELGVSGTGLKKICQRHEIPIPPQGWWARVAAGHRLKAPLLRPATDKRLDSVQIVSRRSSIADHSTVSQKFQVTEGLVPLTTPAELPDWVHRTESALRKRKPDDQGLVCLEKKSAPRLLIGAGSIDRLIRFLSGFDAAIREQGWKLESSDEGLRVLVGLEPVAFEIEDRLSRKPHQPTAAELAEQARRKRLGYSFLGDMRWPKYDYAASGELAFIVQGAVNDGSRRKWGDTARWRLEHVLPSIIESFAEHATAQIAKREQRAEQRRLWDEEAARRRRDEEERRLNQSRFKFAQDIDGVLDQIVVMERVLEHIGGLGELPDELLAFQNWCCDHQQVLKHTVSAGNLTNLLSQAGILGKGA